MSALWETIRSFDECLGDWALGVATAEEKCVYQDECLYLCSPVLESGIGLKSPIKSPEVAATIALSGQCELAGKRNSIAAGNRCRHAASACLAPGVSTNLIAVLLSELLKFSASSSALWAKVRLNASGS